MFFQLSLLSSVSLQHAIVSYKKVKLSRKRRFTYFFTFIIIKLFFIFFFLSRIFALFSLFLHLYFPIWLSYSYLFIVYVANLSIDSSWQIHKILTNDYFFFVKSLFFSSHFITYQILFVFHSWFFIFQFSICSFHFSFYSLG